MGLADWAKNDWLKEHKTSKQELSDLLLIVERDLRDSQVKGISADAQFTHAYSAALTLATILLHVSGYRAGKGQSHHYRTISAIPEVLGSDFKEHSEYLETCRTKRNVAEYDAANEISEGEAIELIDFSKEFEKTVRGWIKGKGW